MNKDFDIPQGSSRFKEACETIKTHIENIIPNASGGGCRAFFTPEEWKAKGERYGDGAIAIVIHDGGDAARFFNYDYESYDLIENMTEELAKHKLFAEQCTNYYTAIYEAE